MRHRYDNIRYTKETTMARHTFKDKQIFTGRFGTGKVMHQIESEVRVDNEDQSEMTIVMTTCGQSSPTYNRHSFTYYKDAEITCKKCLKRVK